MGVRYPCPTPHIYDIDVDVDVDRKTKLSIILKQSQTFNLSSVFLFFRGRVLVSISRHSIHYAHIET